MHQAAGTLLGERYQRYGGPAADLDAAITCFTAAVQELPDGAPDWPSYASALGNVLGMRFEERGNPEDLDAGIRWSREAAADMPVEERWWLLYNLSANFGIRHEMRGDPADLAGALDTAREALVSDPQSRQRPCCRTAYLPSFSTVTNATVPSTTCDPPSTSRRPPVSLGHVRSELLSWSPSPPRCSVTRND
jgi:hypothetical protein